MLRTSRQLHWFYITFYFAAKKQSTHTHKLFNLNFQFPPLFLKSIWRPSSHPNAANEDSLWIDEWDSSRKSDQTSVAVLQPIHLKIQTYCVRMLFELSSFHSDSTEFCQKYWPSKFRWGLIMKVTFAKSLTANQKHRSGARRKRWFCGNLRVFWQLILLSKSFEENSACFQKGFNRNFLAFGELLTDVVLLLKSFQIEPAIKLLSMSCIPASLATSSSLILPTLS